MVSQLITRYVLEIYSGNKKNITFKLLCFRILFSGVTSLPLTTTSRPSLGGENQM